MEIPTKLELYTNSFGQNILLITTSTGSKKEIATEEQIIAYLKKLNEEGINVLQLFNKKEVIKKYPHLKSIETKLASLTAALSIALTGAALPAAAIDQADIPMSATVSTSQTEQPTTYTEETAEEYLTHSSSTTQQEVLTNMSNYIDYYNIEFANQYKEVETNIKPALSIEHELSALTIAYNDFKKEEISAIFNGAQFSEQKLDTSYKNATLQLMGAYVISDSSKPVNLHNLIMDKTGKEFVKKYEEMFYQIKSATTTEEQTILVSKFYEELCKDYPIIKSEVGISHSDKTMIENYQFAIIPMVSAIEIMYQNLNIDNTLSTQVIEYFNDLGMCNIVLDNFEKVVHTIAANCVCYGKGGPIDYSKFSYLKIQELTKKDAYNIQDVKRDFSFTKKFQIIVNKNYYESNSTTSKEQVEVSGSGSYISNSSKFETLISKVINKYSKKEVSEHKETTITKTENRNEAVSKTSESEVKKAEEILKEQITKENKESITKANEEANKLQKLVQEKENQKAEQIKKEVIEEKKKVEEAIKNLNETHKIDQTVITIEKEDQNKLGKVSETIENITTDSTGINNELPNPNDSGIQTPDTESETVENHPSADSGDQANEETTTEDCIEETTTTTNTTEESIEVEIENLTADELLKLYLEDQPQQEQVNVKHL